MIRRLFLYSLMSLFVGKYYKTFAFKIKTKSGQIIRNVTIEATDLDAAKAKLMKRYPGCTVLSSREK